MFKLNLSLIALTMTLACGTAGSQVNNRTLPPEGVPETQDATCENYCQLEAKWCGSTFTTDAECFDACSKFSQDGHEGDATGDSLACRVDYLFNIYEASQVGDEKQYQGLDCPQAGPVANGACTGPLPPPYKPNF